MPVPTQDVPLLADGNYVVSKVNELNFFDLSGSKAKTKGTSNKMYHAELQVAKNGGNAQIFTMYGPTGSVLRKEWRHYTSVAQAEKEYNQILNSKRKKGYRDIDVAQRSFGSEEAKSITKAVQFNNAEHLEKVSKSTLDDGQKRLVEILFGSQAHFVATTLKCPLGQLTNKQIDDGRACLDRAKTIVNNGSLSKKDKTSLLDLTNEFYALIPHNLGAGSRGQMDHLLLNDLTKIMQKEDDLDTLLDAKTVGAQLSQDATLDAKYKTLNADISFVPKGSDLYRFLEDYFMRTKVSGHGYAKTSVKNIWHMRRNDGEWNHFEENVSKIAKECGSHNFAKETHGLSGGYAKNWTPDKRPDLKHNESDTYNKANVWLCWHGTRSANLVGITTRGLLVRPSGAIHTGSMFGDGKYFAWQSTKSLNYTDGGYWTGGRKQNDSRFMFLLDVAMGTQYVAPRAAFYKKPPAGSHSVYGKAHRSGVYNDEMITYDFSLKETQSKIRYLFEISD